VGGVVASLSQWDINLFDAAQSKLEEISSLDPNWSIHEKVLNQQKDGWGLVLVNPSIQKRFTVLFHGAAPTPQTQLEAVFLSGGLEQPYSTTIATVQTATSSPVAVPAPSNVAGICLLALFGLLKKPR